MTDSQNKNAPEEKYFFKRTMLGAYIINRSLDDEQFGDTKFEKILHLADYWAIKRNLNQQYFKKPAGPYDNRFTIAFYEYITNKSNWFVRQQNATDSQQTNFIAGKNHEKSLKYSGFFTASELSKVNRLLSLFKNTDYKVPEVISTLYAVWNNRIILKQEISDALLIQDFYDWDTHKHVYSRDQVERSLNWMRKHEIIPDGTGKFIGKAGDMKNSQKKYFKYE